MRLLTAAQNRYGRYWLQLVAWLPFIGTLHFVEGTRKLDVSNLGVGWRASKSLAGGRALNDIGWHLLDTVLGLAGEDYKPRVSYSWLFSTREYQGYDCEDSAHMILDLQPASDGTGKHAVSCNLKVSRIAVDEVNEIIFNGSDGVLLARGDDIELSVLLASGKRLSTHTACSRRNNFDEMLLFFARELASRVPSRDYEKFGLQDALVTSTIETIYGQDSRPPDIPPPTVAVNPPVDLGKEYPWPRITSDVVKDVENQLQRSISIYNNSGIIGDFEMEFKRSHQRPDWHTLLHNSGTNALHALYFAAQFMPGDEVGLKLNIPRTNLVF